MTATFACGNKDLEFHWELHWFSELPVVGYVHSIGQDFPHIKLVLSPIRQLVGYPQNISATVVPFGLSCWVDHKGFRLFTWVGAMNAFVLSQLMYNLQPL